MLELHKCVQGKAYAPIARYNMQDAVVRVAEAKATSAKAI